MDIQELINELLLDASPSDRARLAALAKDPHTIMDLQAVHDREQSKKFTKQRRDAVKQETHGA